jgi:hypothetical protein
LESAHLRALLADCDWPKGQVTEGFDVKRFWRIDRDKAPELRHTVLTLAAFSDLESHIRACGGDKIGGTEAFLGQNGGLGWVLPESLCLADLGLGHDDRSKVSQPVSREYGPRYLDWQLAQSDEEGWRECAIHARNLLGEQGFLRFKEGNAVDEREARETGAPAVTAVRQRPPQASLFDS